MSFMRGASGALAVLWLTAGALRAASGDQTVVLTSAASIVGVSPFYSDVRIFNTSYTDGLSVTATYRCFLGSCPTAGSPFVVTLSPRESIAFDDICVAVFGAPDSAGGVEFSYVGEPEQLVVTSRLYSTAPVPTVGMFVPGLNLSDAHPDTALTSVRNGGPGAGFRTNVGVFNPTASVVTGTFRLFDGNAAVGNPVAFTVEPHSGGQVNDVFRAAGVETLITGNAVVVVHASGALFSYAAVIDNETSDPYLVRGAPDRPPQAFTPAATATPGQPSSTPTPTLTATATPTPTPTPPAAPTLMQIQAGTFTPRCISCHPNTAGMDLRAGHSYSSLVNVPATTRTGTRVVPFDPDQSVLVNMLAGGHRSVPQNEQTAIRDWILAGAPNN